MNVLAKITEANSLSSFTSDGFTYFIVAFPPFLDKIGTIKVLPQNGLYLNFNCKSGLHIN